MSDSAQLSRSALWVVIPAYNEAGRIGQVLDDLGALDAEIVVVDDHSPDETSAEALQRTVWVLRHLANLGQGAALQTGIRFALERGAEFIVTFDADGQHHREDIMTLVEALRRNGADFALGSRFLGTAPGIPWSRRLILGIAVVFTRLFSGIAVTDTHNGIRAMTRQGAEKIHISMNRIVGGGVNGG